MTESISLTFTHKDHLQSPLVDVTGAVHYTTATTTGLRGHKVTTITAASVVGEIDWREKTFALGGVRRGWDALRPDVGAASGGEREWKWANQAYNLKYVDSYKELLATPTSSRALAPVRFTVPSTHLLHPSEPVTITFPPELQDAEEKMFVLMAILQTETMRLDKNHDSGLFVAIGALPMFN
ncbi:hypothetical protein B0H13DRAFT_2328135 [Mycena leptocephala]|nr:hypothetical protein B0H13DRAFT_2328135 [Mycena leptocephala]